MNDSATTLSSLDLPGRIKKLLEEGGITFIDDLVARLDEDPKSILAINGIGPRTLLNISAALETFESGQIEQYSEPVQSLGDQFKSMLPAEPNTVAVKAENQEVMIMKEKKNKGKKSKKVDKIKEKQTKKDNKKKQKKSDKKKGKKKGKKSKKSKGQKTKKNKKK